MKYLKEIIRQLRIANLLLGALASRHPGLSDGDLEELHEDAKRMNGEVER